MRLNDKVKCVLINNIIAEGIIIKLPDAKDNSIILKSSDGNFIIHNKDNIIMTKIFFSKESPIIKYGDVKEHQIEIEDEIKTEDQIKTEDEIALKAKSLAELKMSLSDIEKNMIKEKLKSHSIGDISNKNMKSRYSALPIEAIKK